MIHMNGSCGFTTAGDVNFTSNSVSSRRWVTDCRSLHQLSTIPCISLLCHLSLYALRNYTYSCIITVQIIQYVINRQKPMQKVTMGCRWMVANTLPSHNIQCESKKIPPPEVFWHFFPNCSEFLVQILHVCYAFLSTLDCKFLFNYLQLWRSYVILSATTQFTSYAQNVHHRPKRTRSGVCESRW